ncbi:MAG: hypothetical protein RL136_2611 [Planctomycetota bacterium]
MFGTMLRPSRALVAAVLLAAPSTALAQNACTDAGVDAGCCEQVCVINPLCCDVAWDAKCEAILASVGCICSGATPIKGNSAAIDTTTATRDLDLSGLCDPGPFGDDQIHNYIVYTWTAPASGRYTLSTCNIADFDTRIAVLAGCSADTVVGCNDDGDGCAAFTSILSVELTGGTEYYIVLGGYSEADVGTGTLTIEEFQVQLALQGAHRYDASAGGNDRWYAKYAVGPGATWEDLRAKAEELGGTLACANTLGESTMIGSIYRATGSGSITAFGLYQDVTDPEYVEPAGGWKWVDGSPLDYTKWSANQPDDSNGTEYYGQFVAYYFGEFWNDNSDDAAWTHAIIEYGPKGPPEQPTPPSNDEAFGAIALEMGQLNTVSLVGATTSADPLLCEDPLFYDRWYSFTAPDSVSYDIVACGNGFDSSTAVYSGSGELVACSGGACTLSVQLAAGSTYLIRIGSPSGDSAGNPTLVVYPTPQIVSLDAISVNFVGGTFADGGDGGRCNETATFPAGAPEWGTLYWSNIVGPSSEAAAGYAAGGNGEAPTALRDGYGEATTASLSYLVNNTWRIFSFPANDSDRMRRGYLDSNGFTSIIATVSDIPYQRYTAVVYFGADGADRAGSITVNAGSPVYFKTDAVPAGVFNPLIEATATDEASAARASYAVFRGLTGATCTMDLAETGPNVGFMGFQIIAEANPCIGDLDGDGAVSAPDLSLLLGSWGTAAADLDGDGTTSAPDLALLLSAWGNCP